MPLPTPPLPPIHPPVPSALPVPPASCPDVDACCLSDATTPSAHVTSLHVSRLKHRTVAPSIPSNMDSPNLTGRGAADASPRWRLPFPHSRPSAVRKWLTRPSAPSGAGVQSNRRLQRQPVDPSRDLGQGRRSQSRHCQWHHPGSSHLLWRAPPRRNAPRGNRRLACALSALARSCRVVPLSRHHPGLLR